MVVARMTDMMSLVQFQEELRRLGRFHVRAATTDPLADVVQQISLNPVLSQSRLLRRLLKALCDQQGDFRPAEASGFDTPTLGLAIALMEIARTGTRAHREWLQAIDAADAAVTSAGAA